MILVCKHLSVLLSFKVQIRNNLRLDTFAELPVSLVLLSLICIDIVERIRYCRLTGRGESRLHQPRSTTLSYGLRRLGMMKHRGFIMLLKEFLLYVLQ